MERDGNKSLETRNSMNSIKFVATHNSRTEQATQIW